jgi:hypothetical protein
MSTGKTEQAYQPQQSQCAIRDFLKNEANHALASLAAMAQPALVACRGHGSAAAA